LVSTYLIIIYYVEIYKKINKIFFSIRFHPPKLQEFLFLGGLGGGLGGGDFFAMNGNRHSARS
jgi:hypothetical protein